LALLLSVIGVYGLTAGEVSAQWRELAVRLALGASHRGIVWTVVRPCAAVLAAGAAIGIVGAFGVRPALASLLHGVEPEDASTLVAAPMLLCVVGIAAAILAAGRVLRVDPAATLRGE
jgi:ABC-type antimicrobial peptide transport system permease subunit